VGRFRCSQLSRAVLRISPDVKRALLSWGRQQGPSLKTSRCHPTMTTPNSAHRRWTALGKQEPGGGRYVAHRCCGAVCDSLTSRVRLWLLAFSNPGKVNNTMSATVAKQKHLSISETALVVRQLAEQSGMTRMISACAISQDGFARHARTAGCGTPRSAGGTSSSRTAYRPWQTCSA